MVEQHLLPVVRDPRVLAAMATVPRHLFVPPRLRDAAYDDRRLFLGWGQFLSRPRTIAAMLAAAGLRGHDRVLEIGTGSGYEAALLGHLAHEVYTVEIVEALARQAATRLACLGATNVTVVAADGGSGHEAEAPYDAILVTAATTRVPTALLEQLADGGRLIIPIGHPDLQELERVTRLGERFEVEVVGHGQLSPLLGDGADQP
jgi:protein-L-isoaspartate(D-aspartate) O-methyltransferase